MDNHETERQRVISLVEERKEFIEGDDGYIYFWPADGNHGCFSPHELRWIADELDKRNASWVASVENYFSSYYEKKERENLPEDDIPF